MVWVLVAVAALLAASLASSKRIRAATAPRPTVLAKERLTREIEELHSRVSAKPDEKDPVAFAVWDARQAWWQRELRTVPIEALKVDGIGASSYETLRRNGINTLADVERLAYMRVPTFGDAKRKAVLTAYQRHRRGLERRNEKLTWEELDAISGGTILRLRSEMSDRSRAKLRSDEAQRIRLAELERRLGAITGEGASLR